MKSIPAKAVLLTLTLLSGTGALAENNNFWVGVKAGTLGLGIEGSWRALPWFDVRGGISQFTYDDDGSQAGVNYNGELSLDNYYLTGNFRFPMSPFRMTLGAFSNGNQLDLVSQDMPFYEIGDIVYTPDEVGTLQSTTSFESVAPYLGAGFDFSIADRFGIALDFGVLWQGDPVVTLTSDGSLVTDPSPAGDIFRDQLESERQQLENEVEDFKAYPVISLGFNFNF